MDPRRGGPHQFVDNFVNITKNKIKNKILINGIRKNINLSFYRDSGRIFYIFEVLINLIKIFLYFKRNKLNKERVINVHGFYNLAPLFYVFLFKKKFNWFIHEEIKKKYFFVFNLLKKKDSIFFLYNPKHLKIKKKDNFFILKPSISTKFWNVKKNKSFNNNFLTVGNLNPLKNHELLLNSINKINKKINLKIVGRNLSSHKAYYDKIIYLKKKIEINSKSRVNLLGNMNKHQVKREMSTSDFFIMTSRSEGTPFALLEAMSCRKVCIIPKIKTLSKIFKNNYNGFYFEDDNVKSLCEVLKKVLHLDKRKKIDIGKRSRELVINEFSNEIFKKKIIKFLKNYE